MQTIRVDIMPVLGGHDMGNRIGMVMADHLGISGRTGSKVQKQCIGCQRLHPLRHRRGLFDHRIKRQPAFPLTADNKPGADIRIILHRTFHMLADIVLSTGDNRRHAGTLEPVQEIFGGQQMGCRNRNCAQLMQSQNRKPELVMPFEYQHDPVTAADTLFLKKGCGTGSVLADLSKGEAALFTRDIAPDHSAALRFIAGDLIDYIVSEIKVFIIHRFKVLDNTILVKTLPAKFLMQQLHIHNSKSFPPPDNPFQTIRHQ